MEPESFRFAISATFTAEPLEPVLRFWERWLGSSFEIRFAPYHQVHQTLIQFASEFAINRHGVNVVMARVEDLGEFDWSAPATLPRLRANFHELLEALRDAPQRYRVPVIFMLCPPSPAFLGEPKRAAFAHEIAALAESEVAQAPGLHYLSYEEVARLYPVEALSSAEGERLGRVPYTELYFCALGTTLVRLLDALFRSPYKAIALDCDNTLWRGICGEDGPTGIVLDPDAAALQRFMREQMEAGMLLVMASKNNEQDVLETFARNPGMPLQLRHFAAWRLNWESKASNISSLADALSLSPDSFIFVDDNPKETAELAEGLPEVLSLTLPERGEPFLTGIWAFDHWSITEEDRKRNTYVAQAREFGRELHQAENLEHFMKSLDLRLQFQTGDSGRLARVAQLTQRTNQFNFTTNRMTEAELAQELSHGLQCLTVEVSDRFGDYGLTGVVLHRLYGRDLVIESFLLSCRVLGRGVEHRVLAHIAAEALNRGAATLVLNFTPTARNRPAQQFLQSLTPDAANSGAFHFDAKQLLSLRWTPEIVHEPVAASAKPAPMHMRPEYQVIAERFGTAELILQAVRSGTVNVSSDPSLTDTERQLASIWSALLGNAAVSAADNFFDLGGHSLLMVQMVLRVREAFGVELPVDDVYSATLTLGGLAQKIESHQRGEAAEYSALLSEIDAMSEEEATRLLNEETSA